MQARLGMSHTVFVATFRKAGSGDRILFSASSAAPKERATAGLWSESESWPILLLDHAIGQVGHARRSHDALDLPAPSEGPPHPQADTATEDDRDQMDHQLVQQLGAQLELSGGRVAEFTFLLDTARLFPLFGLPARLDA